MFMQAKMRPDARGKIKSHHIIHIDFLSLVWARLLDDARKLNLQWTYLSTNLVQLKNVVTPSKLNRNYLCVVQI